MDTQTQKNLTRKQNPSMNKMTKRRNWIGILIFSAFINLIILSSGCKTKERCPAYGYYTQTDKHNEFHHNQ